MAIEWTGSLTIHGSGKILPTPSLIGLLYPSIIVHIEWTVWVKVLLCYLNIHISVSDFTSFVGTKAGHGHLKC